MVNLQVFALSLLLISTTVFAGFQIEVSESPKNDLELTLRGIDSAKKSLFINMYEFTSDAIAEAVIKKVQEGVRVELLQEGQPVGRMSKKGIELKEAIVAAMESRSHNQTDKYFLMTSEANDKGIRRYRYDHAKYLVIDEEVLIVGSENYSPTGHPKPGTKGTRGWETMIHDAWTAQGFLKIFQGDVNMSHGDISQLVQAGRVSFLPGIDILRDISHTPNFRTEFRADDSPIVMDAEFVERLTSPDTSFDGLVAFIRSAKETLDLELLGFSMKWGNTGKLSPLFKEVTDAARRNVAVRVLLNDETVFSGGGHGVERASSKPNQTTVKAFNDYAKKHDVKIEAAIADVKAMGVKYIHNKGAIADNNRVLISSINWNQNSVMNNREAAVAITGREINAHYKELFERDWDASKKK